VRYFVTRLEGALLFTQSILSCKLRQRPEMEARVESNPNALSCKRPHVVTRPDVDQALWLWVQQMDRFCLHAIEQDKAEEEDIYKIDLLEAMVMAERAWKSVSATSIKNCWNHTKIQRP
jgi:hypothetical protein